MSVGWWNHGGTQTVPLSRPASTTHARGAQFMALAQIQMIAVRHSVFCTDFVPFFICCQVFSRLCHDVTVHTYYLWPHSRSTVARSYRSRTVKAAWLWTAALGDRTATTVRAVREQTDSRPTALRSKSRSKKFWTFQNSALRLKRLVRPYGDFCDLPRPHWDRSATIVRRYCDLTRFCRKIGRSMVAVGSQPWRDGVSTMVPIWQSC